MSTETDISKMGFTLSIMTVKKLLEKTSITDMKRRNTSKDMDSDFFKENVTCDLTCIYKYIYMCT